MLSHYELAHTLQWLPTSQAVVFIVSRTNLAMFWKYGSWEWNTVALPSSKAAKHCALTIMVLDKLW